MKNNRASSPTEMINPGISWTGFVPSHWKRSRHSAVLDEVDQVVGNMAQNETLLSLTKRGVIRRDLTESKGKFPASFESYQLVEADQLVFCLFDIDETPRTVGLAHERGIVTGAYDVFSVNNAVASPQYLEYYFISIDNEKRFRPLYTGLRKVIQKPRFKSAPIMLPPREEQQAIADYLDCETQKIDDLITEQRGLIETLRERRQAVTYELVSGLNLEIERWNTGSFIFPSLPNGWKAVSLRRVGKSKSGSGFPPSAQGMTGEDLQFFKVKHLGQADPRDVVHYADDTITRETAKRLGAQIFPPGTIAYAKVGAALMLGRIRTLGSEGCMDNNMAGFILSEGVESRFLQLAMSCIPFDYLVNPGAVPSLSDKNLMAMKIPLPPMDVQRKVSGEVDAQTSHIDELIAESEDLIALSQERRTALITAAVTGQIDVRTAA